jgi:hypothetical protein
MSGDFETRRFQAGRLEPWFRRTFPDRFERVVAKVVVVSALFGAIGFAGGFLMRWATGG